MAALAALGPALGARFAHKAFLEIGPNDGDYLRGFREDWERDGATRFRWTSPGAVVTLPIFVQGDGFKLRMRLRRHFVEPSHVRVAVEGKTVHAFDIAADPKIAYRIEEVALPTLSGRQPFALTLQTRSENPRPLGIALDWLEVERTGGGRFVPLASMALRLALVALVAFAVPRVLGSSRALAAAHASLVVGAGVIGTALHPIAAERILREGCGAYVAVALIVLGLLRWRRTRAALDVAAPGLAGALAISVLLALGVRLVLLLHPQFYYPDVRVHALFVRELARHGLVPFLRDFTLNQFRYSLGLQFENGHWYAFPYPPAFYVLCWPLVRFAAFAPEIAASVLAAAVNSLEVLLVFAIGRRLGAGVGTSLVAAAAVPLLPLFTTRLTLGYFPALVGHAMDALTILVLLAKRRELDKPKVIGLVALLITLALLTYTQSLVNLGLLLPLFLLLQIGFDRPAWRRQLGLAVAGALGALISLALFYGRYLPVFLDMRSGVAMEGESVLIEKLERLEKQRAIAAEAPEQASDDPYTGESMDLTRGARKSVARMLIFYGPLFAVAIAAGFLLLIKRSEAEIARFVLAWGAVYLLLNLGSAGLPGPNLLRYNKDLEIVAPLCCLALATIGVWLWERARVLGVAYAAGYLWLGWTRAVASLLARFE